jgi:hypothetical protein
MMVAGEPPLSPARLRILPVELLLLLSNLAVASLVLVELRVVVHGLGPRLGLGA